MSEAATDRKGGVFFVRHFGSHTWCVSRRSRMEEIELVAESLFCYKFSAPSSAEPGSFTGRFIQVLNEEAVSYLATYARIEATSTSAEQEWDGDTIGCTKRALIIPVYFSTVRSGLNPRYDSLAHLGPNTVEKTRTTKRKYDVVLQIKVPTETHSKDQQGKTRLCSKTWGYDKNKTSL